MAVPQIIIYALNQIHALYLFHVFLDELTDFLAVVRVYYAYSDAVIQRPIYLVHQFIVKRFLNYHSTNFSCFFVWNIVKYI